MINKQLKSKVKFQMVSLEIKKIHFASLKDRLFRLESKFDLKGQADGHQFLK